MSLNKLMFKWCHFYFQVDLLNEFLTIDFDALSSSHMSVGENSRMVSILYVIHEYAYIDINSYTIHDVRYIVSLFLNFEYLKEVDETNENSLEVPLLSSIGGASSAESAGDVMHVSSVSIFTIINDEKNV